MATLPSRTQFLSTLSRLGAVPDDVDDECPVCTDDISNPIRLPCAHVFCEACITKWLQRRKRNTCPTCRTQLFTVTSTDRGPVGADRVRVHAEAIEFSGLLTENRYDSYGIKHASFADVQRAAGEASAFLSLDSQPSIPDTRGALIDVGALQPQLIAMANLLRGYARATDRAYSGYQRRDWKLIVGRINKILRESAGQVITGDDLQDLAKLLHLLALWSLKDEGVDIRSGHFFDSDARLESPSADLEVLINYVVHLCVEAFEKREKEKAQLKVLQREALEAEKSKMGKALRWSGQKIFGGV